MKETLITTVAGALLFTKDEQEQAVTLQTRLYELRALRDKYAQFNARKAIKKQVGAFDSDPTMEGFNELESGIFDAEELQKRAKLMQRRARTFEKTFYERECVPFLKGLMEKALALTEQGIERLKQPEQEVAARLGIDYQPSGNIRQPERRVAEIRQRLAIIDSLSPLLSTVDSSEFTRLLEAIGLDLPARPKLSPPDAPLHVIKASQKAAAKVGDDYDVLPDDELLALAAASEVAIAPDATRDKLIAEIRAKKPKEAK